MKAKRAVAAVVLCAALCAGCASQQIVPNKKKAADVTITFSGGSGESYDSAIVINGATNQSEGIDAEYRYISKIHGQKEKDWRLDGQTMYREEKQIYDVIEITILLSSQKRIYYFNVTKFPWKRKGIQ